MRGALGTNRGNSLVGQVGGIGSLTGRIGGTGSTGGTKDYNKLINKPSLNGHELVGNTDMSEVIDPETGLGLKINDVPIKDDTTLDDLGSVPITNQNIDDIFEHVFGD